VVGLTNLLPAPGPFRLGRPWLLPGCSLSTPPGGSLAAPRRAPLGPSMAIDDPSIVGEHATQNKNNCST
jgi:hypothetical protein